MYKILSKNRGGVWSVVNGISVFGQRQVGVYHWGVWNERDGMLEFGCQIKKITATSFKYLHRISKDITRVEQNNCKKRNRVTGLSIGVGATGVLESVCESLRSESLSQLWLHTSTPL